MNEKITRTIFAAIDQTNLLLPKGEKLPKSPETHLVGSDSALDSLGLINFVVALESQILSNFGRSISLVDTAALPATESPFRTVAILADYLKKHLESSDAPGK
jgi:acyl carrier protein